MHPQERASQLLFQKSVGSGSNGGLGDAESGTTCPTLSTPKTGRGNVQFAAETAAITGESKREINRQVALANALGDDLQRVEGTSLDKGVELAALAKMSGPERTLEPLQICRAIRSAKQTRPACDRRQGGGSVHPRSWVAKGKPGYKPGYDMKFSCAFPSSHAGCRSLFGSDNRCYLFTGSQLQKSPQYLGTAGFFMFSASHPDHAISSFRFCWATTRCQPR